MKTYKVFRFGVGLDFKEFNICVGIYYARDCEDAINKHGETYDEGNREFMKDYLSATAIKIDWDEKEKLERVDIHDYSAIMKGSDFFGNEYEGTGNFSDGELLEIEEIEKIDAFKPQKYMFFQ